MSVKQIFNTSAELDYPTVLPTLDLDFANSKTLDPRITFTRASGGSYVGADGLIKYAGVNEARFDHNPVTGESLGLLIEESRTNLVTYSDAITNSNLYVVVVATLTQVTTTTPISGLAIATKVFLNIGANAGNSTNGFIFGGFSLTNSTVYTQSIFVKASGSSVFRLRSNVTGQVFDIPIAGPAPTLTGTITSCTVTPYPDGWSRISWTFTSTTSIPGNRGDHWVMKPNIADGSSGFLVTGAQLELGSFPTSYIPTEGSTRTRAADNASITGKNFSEWYNHGEGTLAATASIRGANTVVSTGLAIINGIAKLAETALSANSRVIIFNAGASPNRYTAAQRSAVSIIALNDNTYETIQFGKYYNLTMSYVNNSTQGLALSVDGRTVLTNATAVDVPVSTRLLIGAGNYGSNPGQNADEYYLNGTIKRLTYYPKRLPNAQLQALTK